jgi:outer membrane protein assembly factor BamD
MIVLAVSCSSLGEERDEFANLSTEEQFYRDANRQLNSSNFTGAVRTYEALESRFPFGQYAAQAQIELQPTALSDSTQTTPASTMRTI